MVSTRRDLLRIIHTSYEVMIRQFSLLLFCIKQIFFYSSRRYFSEMLAIGMDVKLLVLLISALYVGNLSASSSGCFTFKERLSVLDS
jgi:hypothetical protein